MKKLYFLFTVVILNFVFISPAMAVIEVPDMANQIKLLVQENLATTEAKLKERLNLQSLVGFVGKITTISSGNLTIDSHNNLLQVTTTANTSFIKNGVGIKITSLALGDKIILIGTSVKNGIVVAKRINVIKDEPVLVKTSVIVANVTAVDLKKKTITLSLNGSDQVFILSKKSTVKLDELDPGQTILGIIKEYNGILSISRAKIL